MKKLIIPLTFVLSVVFITLLGTSCAKVGSPEGGPKDTLSPVVVKTKPENFTTDISPNKIQITFNEYVIIQNERTEFVVSPFTEEQIIPRINNKSVIIDLRKLEIDSSRTYSFDFGKSIADNNEKNLFSDYRFVFSPKPYIDSMSISGSIVSAFDLLPIKDGISIHLYSNLHDSVPKTSNPDYIAKADNEGNFIFSNIENGTYRLFALKDGNMNNIYDLETETIAFLDSNIALKPYIEYDKFYYSIDTLTPDSINGEPVDTIIYDTIMFSNRQVGFLHMHDSHVNDSVQALIDSLVPQVYFTDSTLMVYTNYIIELHAFSKDVRNQLLIDYSFKDKKYMTLEFQEEIIDSSLQIQLLHPQYDSIWYIEEMHPENKKLTLWMWDTIITQNDSIVVEVIYPVLDSNQLIVDRKDTLNFLQKTVETREKETKEKRGLLARLTERDTIAKKDTIIVPKITFSNSIKKTGHDLHKPAIFVSGTPIEFIDTSRIELYHLEDSVEHPENFRFERDTSNIRQFIIQKEWEENLTYKLMIPEGTIRDIYGAINDTSISNFITQKADHYGVLNLSVKNVTDYTIIQYLNEKESLLDEFFIESDTVISIEYIDPAKYFFKAIIDENRNKKWDSGDYDEKRQPETVIYYNGDITIRSNWDHETTWDLGDLVRQIDKE